MMMKSMKSLALTMGLLATTAATASASSVYGTAVGSGDLTGTRTGDGTQILYGGTSNALGYSRFKDMTVTWTISQKLDGTWDYDYKFTINQTKAKTFSHVILELSDGVELADMKDWSGVDEGKSAVDTFKPGGSNSNPNLPGDIFGVKLEPSPSDSDPFHITFNIDRAPVWGNFYAKAGSDEYAYNAGFANLGSDNIMLFIARPDGAGVIPEPTSIVMLGLGAAGLMGVAARRRKAQSA